MRLFLLASMRWLLFQDDCMVAKRRMHWLRTREKQKTSFMVILVNVIPPDYVNEVPVVEPNQHYDVLVVHEPVLVDEDEDPKEDEFKQEQDPQEEEDDMEIDIEEDENEPKMT
nr:hypothetical protein [Tanacetum cinerariifolium]